MNVPSNASAADEILTKVKRGRAALTHVTESATHH
jgi:hypothetical protein